jgi:hypothetical protein
MAVALPVSFVYFINLVFIFHFVCVCVCGFNKFKLSQRMDFVIKRVIVKCEVECHVQIYI